MVIYVDKLRNQPKKIKLSGFTKVAIFKVSMMKVSVFLYASRGQ